MEGVGYYDLRGVILWEAVDRIELGVLTPIPATSVSGWMQSDTLGVVWYYERRSGGSRLEHGIQHETTPRAIVALCNEYPQKMYGHLFFFSNHGSRRL